jgi:hypothetical protein
MSWNSSVRTVMGRSGDERPLGASALAIRGFGLGRPGRVPRPWWRAARAASASEIASLSPRPSMGAREPDLPDLQAAPPQGRRQRWRSQASARQRVPALPGHLVKRDPLGRVGALQRALKHRREPSWPRQNFTMPSRVRNPQSGEALGPVVQRHNAAAYVRSRLGTSRPRPPRFRRRGSPRRLRFALTLFPDWGGDRGQAGPTRLDLPRR